MNDTDTQAENRKTRLLLAAVRLYLGAYCSDNATRAAKAAVELDMAVDKEIKRGQ